MNDASMQSEVDLGPSQSPSPRYVWYVLLLLATVNLFNYMDRMAMAILSPLIKAELELSDAQLGLLIGFAFFLFYAICGIPIARWADRGSRRDIIAIALAVWSAMTAICGAAQNFWHFFLARVGVGAGEAGSFPSASSIVCDYIPLKGRSGAFSVLGVGSHIGTMLGMGLVGWLGEVIGWRWAFVVIGLPGIALAVVVRLTLREPIRGGLDPAPDGEVTGLPEKTLQVLWRCKTYRFLMLYFVMSAFAQSGLMQWWPSFYTRVFGISLSSVGVNMGIALGLGQVIGLLAGGLLANKIAQRDIRGPLLLGVAATVLAPIAAMGSLFVSSALVSVSLVWLTALLWSVTTGPAMATVYSIVPSRIRATAGAIAIFVLAVLGFGGGPFLVGILSDMLAPSFGQEALRYALLAPICLFPMAAIGLYAAAKASPIDLKAAGA